MHQKCFLQKLEMTDDNIEKLWIVNSSLDYEKIFIVEIFSIYDNINILLVEIYLIDWEESIQWSIWKIYLPISGTVNEYA